MVLRNQDLGDRCAYCVYCSLGIIASRHSCWTDLGNISLNANTYICICIHLNWSICINNHEFTQVSSIPIRNHMGQSSLKLIIFTTFFLQYWEIWLPLSLIFLIYLLILLYETHILTHTPSPSQLWHCQLALTIFGSDLKWSFSPPWPLLFLYHWPYYWPLLSPHPDPEDPARLSCLLGSFQPLVSPWPLLLLQVPVPCKYNEPLMSITKLKE